MSTDTSTGDTLFEYKGVLQPAGMTVKEMGNGVLSRQDAKWRDIYRWLFEQGYKLRPRFHPDWIPSWKGTDKNPRDCEDGIRIPKQSIIDAVRISDGAMVILKRVLEPLHPHEAAISTFLSRPELRDDPKNHAVPVYEVLRPPEWDEIILVMPMLGEFDQPEFGTVGEVVGCVQQLFEGLNFLHQRNIAHRDCKSDNIMMDARSIFPDGWHPANDAKNASYTADARSISRSDSHKPIKYYFIDFGISLQFHEGEPHKAEPILSGDRTVPEFQDGEADQPYDPFPTDVYLLGNAIKEVFLDGSEYTTPIRGLDFLVPLVNDMTQTDPTKRPTMQEVVTRFDTIVSSLGTWKLRAPAAYAKPWIVTFFLWFGRTRRHLLHMLMRTPPIPPYP